MDIKVKALSQNLKAANIRAANIRVANGFKIKYLAIKSIRLKYYIPAGHSKLVLNLKECALTK